MHDTPRRYEHPNPGRLDVKGTEWHACDPYPTWYRWTEDSGLVVLGSQGEIHPPSGTVEYIDGWMDGKGDYDV